MLTLCAEKEDEERCIGAYRCGYHSGSILLWRILTKIDDKSDEILVPHKKVM